MTSWIPLVLIVGTSVVMIIAAAEGNWPKAIFCLLVIDGLASSVRQRDGGRRDV